MSPATASPSAPYVSMRIETQEPGIAEVILQGPGKGNSLGPDFFRELPAAFRALDADPAVRVVVLRGQGGHVTYGGDLGAMAGTLGSLVAGAPGASDRLRLLALIHELQDAITSVARCRKPVVAAVAGYCIGGGLDLIAACDVRLASRDAKLSLREVKVGMVADLGSLQRLPPLIGEGNTRELAFTGGDIDAARALRIGLVNEVFESEAELLDGARALARTIAAQSPLVVQGIKAVMNDRSERAAADGLRTVALWNSAFLPSEDVQEALAAFAERRPPAFRGR